MVKTWYKVITDSGWFKEATLEAVIETATNNEFHKVKRVIKVTERDCSLKELTEGK